MSGHGILCPYCAEDAANMLRQLQPESRVWLEVAKNFNHAMVHEHSRTRAQNLKKAWENFKATLDL